MLAASSVEKSSPGPSRRPATKKSPVPLRTCPARGRGAGGRRNRRGGGGGGRTSPNRQAYRRSRAAGIPRSLSRRGPPARSPRPPRRPRARRRRADPAPGPTRRWPARRSCRRRTGVCAGTIARATPSCAICATFVACVLVSGRWSRPRRSSCSRRPFNDDFAPPRGAASRTSASPLPSAVRTPGHDPARRRIDDVADGVDGDEGGDDEPVGQGRSTRCRCRPSSPGRARPACRPSPRLRRRRCPRRSDRRSRSWPRRYPQSAVGRIFGLPTPRSKRIAAGTIGTRPPVVRSRRPVRRGSASRPRRRRGRTRCRRTARSLDLVDEVDRVQQVRFARAGRRTPDIHRRQPRRRRRRGPRCSRSAARPW